MNPIFLLGIGIFFALFLVGRYITSGAAKLLSDEEKARLVDFSMQQRKISIPVTILLIVVIFLRTPYTIFLFLIVVVLLNWYQQWKLTSMGFPQVYRTRLLIGTIITFSGIGIPYLYYFVVSTFFY